VNRPFFRISGALVLSLLLIVPPVQAENSEEACFRSRVNAERRAVGHRELIDNPKVDEIARRHSRQMAADQTIYHNNDLAGEYNWIGGYEYGGENVGMGPDCDSIHQGFMASSGHRDNILDPDYTQIGVGVTVRDDTLYVTTDFFTPKHRSVRPPTVKPRASCSSG